MAQKLCEPGSDEAASGPVVGGHTMGSDEVMAIGSASEEKNGEGGTRDRLQ